MSQPLSSVTTAAQERHKPDYSLFRQVCRTFPDTITATDAKCRQKRVATSVFAGYKRLHAILERHQATIQRRWLDWRHSRRQKTLEAAWPEIPRDHRLIWAVWFGITPRPNDDSYWDMLLWPYLNLRDLTKPRPLLLMLRARGRNPPATFARADVASARFLIISETHKPNILNKDTALLTGDSPKEYGRIISWEDDEYAFGWLMTCAGIEPRGALMVLDMQDRLLQFLIKCCEDILHDIPNILDCKPQPAPTLTVGDDSEWLKLSAIRMEAPYQIPGKINFPLLTALLEGRISDVHGHFQSLREDPAYFRSSVYEWSQHRSERLLDTKGNKHPGFDPRLDENGTQKRAFWERLVGTVVGKAFNDLTLWRIPLQMLHELADQVFQHSAVLDAWGQDVQPPEPFVQAFFNVYLYLVRLRQMYDQTFNVGLTSAPTLREYWRRKPYDPKRGTTVIVLNGAGTEGDELIELVSSLQDGVKLHAAGLPNIMDEVQRLIDTEGKFHNKITSWLGNIFGDLALIGECTGQLHLFTPWADPIEANLTEVRLKATHEHITQLLETLKHSPIQI